MAVDAALVASVRGGGLPTLRLYTWSPRCLSLGRNQPARDVYPREALARAGIEVVRRPTGGRAVLHDAELTYSAAFPARLLDSPRAAYCRINEVLAAGLCALGAEARLHTGAAGDLSLSVRPCFADPAPGEIAAGGRKVVGSAQARVNGVVLQHGSIVLARTAAADRLAAAGVPDLEGKPAYLADLLGVRPPLHALSSAIESAWQSRIGPLLVDRLSETELESARRLEPSFADDAWTWRR
jgi:lipoate-protein ligase A